MTSSDHKKFILETYKSDHDLLGLSAVDCGSILTDDCKMLQLYIGERIITYIYKIKDRKMTNSSSLLKIDTGTI